MSARTIVPALFAGLLGLLVAGGAAAADKQRLTLSGGTQGGSVYTFGTALASVVNKYSPSVELSVRSGGTTENILLLESGELKLAGASGVDYFIAKNAQPKDSASIRTVTVMFPFLQVVVVPRDSPANTVADMKGKRFGMADRRTGSYTVNKIMFDVLGIGESDMRAQYQSLNTMVDALRGGSLDGFAVVLPAGGAPFVSELANSSRGLKFLWLPPADLARLLKQYPFFTPLSFPAKSLPGVDKEAFTYGYWGELLATADLADEVTYQIVKVMHEHHAELMQIFRSTSEATPQNTLEAAAFPLHPGVQKYYRETGVLK